MKKLISVTFALLLLCSAVTLVSCGKDDDKKGGRKPQKALENSPKMELLPK